MHNPILLTAICALVSFFIGAIPFGLILGRVFNHTDIRKAGSGNIGTTNALRVAGPKVAALTLLLDCLKGAICVIIARPLIADMGPTPSVIHFRNGEPFPVMDALHAGGAGNS